MHHHNGPSLGTPFCVWNGNIRRGTPPIIYRLKTICLLAVTIQPVGTAVYRPQRLCRRPCRVWEDICADISFDFFYFYRKAMLQAEMWAGLIQREYVETIATNFSLSCETKFFGAPRTPLKRHVETADKRKNKNKKNHSILVGWTTMSCLDTRQYDHVLLSSFED